MTAALERRDWSAAPGPAHAAPWAAVRSPRSWPWPGPPTSSRSPAGSPTRPPGRPRCCPAIAARLIARGRRGRAAVRGDRGAGQRPGLRDRAAGRAGGPGARRRRADDHQRRHRLHGAAGQELPGPGRRGRGRGADLPGRDHGLPRLRGRRARRARGRRRDCASTCWPTSWPAGCGPRSSTRSRTSRTRPACRCRPSAAPGAGRPRPPVRLPDPARTSPTASWASAERAAAEPVVDGPGRGAAGRAPSPRSSRRASGWAGPPGRPRSSAALVVAKQNSDQCAGALGPADDGGVRAQRRTWTRQIVRSRALYAPARRAGRRGADRAHARGHHLDHAARAASTSGSPRRTGSTRWRCRRRPATRKVAYVPGRPFYPGDDGDHPDPAGLQPGRRRPDRRGHPPDRRGAHGPHWRASERRSSAARATDGDPSTLGDAESHFTTEARASRRRPAGT